MTWSTSSDVRELLDVAGEFLSARPVDHTALLTETAYLSARAVSNSDQLYGWWRADGAVVAGVFVQAPRHPAVLSDLPVDAIEFLVDVLPDMTQIGVSGRLVDAVVAAWQRRRGVVLAERSRIRLYRLERLRPPSPPPGRARVATLADRALLVSWYEQLMARYPDDLSDLAYVVDDPISYGGIVLWEVDGVPVAMAGRSRLVAGMVRLSAVYAPDAGPVHATAAFVAACQAAQKLARDVLVFTGAADTVAAAAYLELGFAPVLDRVTLAVSS